MSPLQAAICLYIAALLHLVMLHLLEELISYEKVISSVCKPTALMKQHQIEDACCIRHWNVSVVQAQPAIVG